MEIADRKSLARLRYCDATGNESSLPKSEGARATTGKFLSSDRRTTIAPRADLISYRECKDSWIDGLPARCETRLAGAADVSGVRMQATLPGVGTSRAWDHRQRLWRLAASHPLRKGQRGPAMPERTRVLRRKHCAGRGVGSFSVRVVGVV